MPIWRLVCVLYVLVGGFLGIPFCYRWCLLRTILQIARNNTLALAATGIRCGAVAQLRNAFFLRFYVICCLLLLICTCSSLCIRLLRDTLFSTSLAVAQAIELLLKPHASRPSLEPVNDRVKHTPNVKYNAEEVHKEPSRAEFEKQHHESDLYGILETLAMLTKRLPLRQWGSFSNCLLSICLCLHSTHNLAWITFNMNLRNIRGFACFRLQ
mmetsp:Transcript_78321/g.123662  ORF Transcript_78321/g.123662 Transcript_78321/m.123662 type:complete len:212 (+) Transcript_78321:200-835(+)